MTPFLFDCGKRLLILRAVAAEVERNQNLVLHIDVREVDLVKQQGSGPISPYLSVDPDNSHERVRVLTQFDKV
jgi:hypothetical protein